MKKSLYLFLIIGLGFVSQLDSKCECEKGWATKKLRMCRRRSCGSGGVVTGNSNGVSKRNLSTHQTRLPLLT